MYYIFFPCYVLLIGSGTFVISRSIRDAMMGGEERPQRGGDGGRGGMAMAVNYSYVS